MNIEKLIETGWSLQPSAVNKLWTINENHCLNLGTTNTEIIDLTLKMQSHDIISPLINLTSMKLATEL